MDVPIKVQEAAKGLIDMYGLSFDYLGKYAGADFYMLSKSDRKSVSNNLLSTRITPRL